ncbi:MAG: hypothetical protein NE328_03700 [Lentisphaeraceae bacterium]|nr:hypothetical protein [Lentisphaeraceae bacterium]
MDEVRIALKRSYKDEAIATTGIEWEHSVQSWFARSQEVMDALVQFYSKPKPLFLSNEEKRQLTGYADTDKTLFEMAYEKKVSVWQLWHYLNGKEEGRGKFKTHLGETLENFCNRIHGRRYEIKGMSWEQLVNVYVNSGVYLDSEYFTERLILNKVTGGSLVAYLGVTYKNPDTLGFLMPINQVLSCRSIKEVVLCLREFYYHKADGVNYFELANPNYLRGALSGFSESL